MKEYGRVAVAAAAALALSACGGDGTTAEPSASGATSSASQSSESPSSSKPQKATPDHPAQNLVPPELPDEAKQFTKEGFAAFIGYWFEAQNYGIATGERTYVEAVSHDECRFCNVSLSMINNVANGGGEVWIVGGELQPTDINVNFQGEYGELQNAYLTLRQVRADAYDEGGVVDGGKDILEDFVEPFEFAAVHRDGQWQAVRIEVRK